MSAAKVTAKLTSTITTKSGRTIQVGYVTANKNWKRYTLDSGVEEEFKKAAEKYIESYNPKTTAVVLQETPHSSKSDQRTHYTAVEMDDKDEHVATRHLPVD